MIIAVGLPFALVSVSALILTSVICWKRRNQARTIKKRVVLVMDANTIYDGRAVVPSKSLVVPSIPRVKIVEGGRRRYSSDITAVTEWELPLDEQWEFPRNKFVFMNLILMNLILK